MHNERDVEFTPDPAIRKAADEPGAGGPGRAGSGASAGAGGPSEASGVSRPTGAAGGSPGVGSGEPGGLDNVADLADDKAQALGAKAREVADDVRHRAADQVESRVAQQKHRAVDTLEDVAQSLRTAGHQMTDREGLGQYMTRAASHVDNLASFLNNRDVAELAHEVEDFARRQPAVFVGGAFALGVLGARFLRSSRRDSGHEGPATGWADDDRTARVEDPLREGIGRPAAPGYTAPEQRGQGGFGAPGSL
jgi:hypothetical protein